MGAPPVCSCALAVDNAAPTSRASRTFCPLSRRLVCAALHLICASALYVPLASGRVDPFGRCLSLRLALGPLGAQVAPSWADATLAPLPSPQLSTAAGPGDIACLPGCPLPSLPCPLPQPRLHVGPLVSSSGRPWPHPQNLRCCLQAQPLPPAPVTSGRAACCAPA